MKNIRNPFTDLEGFNCFGCCPGNPIGLKMTFIEDGDYVISEWQPSKHYQGYPNVLHGGIQTALMDEIASWTVYIKAKTGGVTSTISVEFIKPLHIDKGPVTLKARLLKTKSRIARVQVELFNRDNLLCSKSIAEYYIYPEEIARQRYSFPGYESFYFD